MNLYWEKHFSSIALLKEKRKDLNKWLGQFIIAIMSFVSRLFYIFHDNSNQNHSKNFWNYGKLILKFIREHKGSWVTKQFWKRTKD